MTPCPREGRWIGGCRFEPRYDDVPFTAEERDYAYQSVVFVQQNIDILDTLRTRTYVRDVCIRCGKTIERGADAQR